MAEIVTGTTTLLLFIILFINDCTYSQHPDCGSVLKSGSQCRNYILNGATSLLTTKMSSKMRCVSLCLRTTGCKSVNFNTKTLQCDLLDVNRSDLTAQNLEQNSDYFYCEIQTKEETKPRSTADICQPTGADCAEIFSKQFTTNGVYVISPTYAGGVQEKVLCDMDNGGWIVIQQRIDGSVSFDQNWQSYRDGFGSLDTGGEFWLGLDTILGLTNSGGNWKLRVELEDWHGNSGYAEYSLFRLDGALFTLTAEGYSGNIGDSLAFHTGQSFSTKDRDNDNAPVGVVNTHCALTYQSGWWFDYCLHSNLNGVYNSNYNAGFNKGIQWEEWVTYHNAATTGLDMNAYSMKAVTMKIRKS